MTLNTHVYVHDEIVPAVVFAKCQELIGAETASTSDRGNEPWDDSRCLMNEPGQGFPAWLMLDYRMDGPLRVEEGDEDDYDPACYLRISFDTAYGYADEMGRGCGDLHACYVAELGRWFDDREVAWSWQNEFTGEIYGGPDRYDRLVDLTGGAAQATAWFSSMILPAIQAFEVADTRSKT